MLTGLGGAVTEDRPRRDPYVAKLEARVATLAGDNVRLTSELAAARAERDAISGLLEVSSLARGEVVLDRQAIALDHAVTSALEASAPLVAARQQVMTSEVPHDLRVDADRVRLVQVLTNLIVNAATSTPPGGSIRIRAVAQGNVVAIRIKDGGRGIAIIKNLVELHGGSVDAVSAEQDTEILLSWPAALRRRKRVLVVDDNVDAAETLAEMLRLMGHEVVVAHDVAGALATAETAKPQIALLDLELAQRLKTHRELAGVSLVALTGDSTQRGHGFEHHLVKPLDPDQLAKLLDED
jgi:CheY-like chemotaxis protein